MTTDPAATRSRDANAAWMRHTVPGWTVPPPGSIPGLIPSDGTSCPIPGIETITDRLPFRIRTLGSTS